MEKLMLIFALGFFGVFFSVAAESIKIMKTPNDTFFLGSRKTNYIFHATIITLALIVVSIVVGLSVRSQTIVLPIIASIIAMVLFLIGVKITDKKVGFLEMKCKTYKKFLNAMKIISFICCLITFAFSFM